MAKEGRAYMKDNRDKGLNIHLSNEFKRGGRTEHRGNAETDLGSEFTLIKYRDSKLTKLK